MVDIEFFENPGFLESGSSRTSTTIWIRASFNRSTTSLIDDPS
jgi:hypothetical protein